MWMYFRLALSTLGSQSMFNILGRVTRLFLLSLQRSSEGEIYQDIYHLCSLPFKKLPPGRIST